MGTLEYEAEAEAEELITTPQLVIHHQEMTQILEVI
jgi:hypothetical protein